MNMKTIRGSTVAHPRRERAKEMAAAKKILLKSRREAGLIQG